jgi:sugar phosphate isomerase/epimerase
VDSVLRVCKQLNEANRLVQEQGVIFGYHNHDFEFTPVGGRTAFEIMIAELDPSIILEVDTYWVQFAGHDPGELVRRLGPRSPLLHIKDGSADRSKREEPMVALGEGAVDIEAIIRAAGQNGQYLIVELDRCATDMMTAIDRSYQFLSDEGWLS